MEYKYNICLRCSGVEVKVLEIGNTQVQTPHNCTQVQYLSKCT